jgi:pyrophosphatase PpaX
MAGIKTVVFDSDGTLLDGFSIIVGAYAHVAALHGRIAPTEAEVRGQLAQSLSIYQIYANLFPGENVEQLVHENSEFVAEHGAEWKPFSGLEEMLASLQGLDLKLAIVTGGNYKIHDLLQHNKIEKYFASIVHCDRVSRSKPDPEGFLLAMDECGTLPHEAVMVGDSPNDIFAGKNAGAAYTIGITHGHGSKQDLAAADADYIAGSLAEVAAHIKGLRNRG